MMSDLDKITELKQQLARLITPWQADGSIPPRFSRERGDGTVLVNIDPSCGGFQDPHKGNFIGYKGNVFKYGKTCGSCHVIQGLVPVSEDEDGRKRAIADAKRICDKFLEKLGLEFIPGNEPSS